MAQIDELYIKLGIKNGQRVKKELADIYKQQTNIAKIADAYVKSIEKQNVRIKNKNKFIKNVQAAVVKAQLAEKKAHKMLLKDKEAAERKHQQMLNRIDARRLQNKLRMDREAARKAERLQKQVLDKAWGRGRFGRRGGGGSSDSRTSMWTIAGGNLIANAISSFFSFLTRKIKEGYERFVAVERGIATAQLGLFLQGKYTQVRDQALRDQSKDLSLKYGVNRAQLLGYAGQGLAGGMSPDKMRQAMDAAVRLSISTMKPIDTIFMQINKAINSGYLDETILSVVPALKNFSTTSEVREKALDTIQKQLARFPDFQDKSLGRAIDKLSARFSHWMQKNLEPMMDGLRTSIDVISNNIMGWIEDKVNLAGITGIIGSFLKHQLKRMASSDFFDAVVKASEQWIKGFLMAVNDHIEALVGDPNKTLIAQYLRANNLPVSLWGMIRFWVRQVVKILVEEIKLAAGKISFWDLLTGGGGGGDDDSSSANKGTRIPLLGALGDLISKRFKELEAQRLSSQAEFQELLNRNSKGTSVNDQILKNWEKASKNGVRDVTDPDVKKDLENSGAFNTNINIYTNQAGEVIKSVNDELVAYYRQYGNVSVVA